MEQIGTEMVVHNVSGLSYLTFPSFDETGVVRHLFSTRHGGVSSGFLGAMNLSFGRGDNPQNVRENYRRICAAAGIYPGNLVFTQQTHTANIVYVNQLDRGKGLLRPVEMRDVDGLITDQPEVALVSFHADCVPLFFLDPVRKVIGLAHAGWRGTVAGIGGRMVKRMKEDFGCNPRNILVGIGPSIGPCCFEVGPEVAEEFRGAFPEFFHREIILPGKREGRNQVDLWAANRIDVTLAGVPLRNVTMPDCCTCCHPEDFFSHRKVGNDRGSMVAIMEMK